MMNYRNETNAKKTRLGILITCCAAMLSCSLTEAAPVAHQKDPKAGIWGIWDLETEMIPADPVYNGDWLRGSMIAVDWHEIQPTKNGGFKWGPLNSKLNAGIKNLEQAILIVYHGDESPHWIYNGNCKKADNKKQDGCVPVVCYRNSNNNIKYPDYVDPDYEIYLKPVITAVANHIKSASSPEGVPYKDFVTIVQCPIGKSGDPNPYEKNNTHPLTYINGYAKNYLPIGSTAWKNWERMISKHYFNSWKNSGIFMLYKPANHNIFYNEEPFKSNEDQLMMKTAYVTHGYQNNRELSNLDEMENLTKRYLVRGELAEPLKKLIGAPKKFNFDDSDDGNNTYRYWNDRPRQNIYWQCLWMLHFGMDVFNIRDVENFEQGLVPGKKKPANKQLRYWKDAQETFIFFNERAGIKNARNNSNLPLASDKPWKSKYSFIAFREGLDYNSTKYVSGPVPTIGTTAAKNRFTAIKNAVNNLLGSDGHVEMGDPNSANNNKTPLAYLKKLKYQNDVNHKIYTGNYTMFITQINKDSTSQGYWNMGQPESLSGGERYGKYARGFKTGKTKMFFNVNDKFIGSTANTNPGNGYEIDIVVTYLDKGNSSFKLIFDGDSGSTTAYTQTTGNTNTWKTRTYTTTAARFQNNLANGSDIILEKVSGKPIFHMIQVNKVDDGVGGSNLSIGNIANVTVDEGGNASRNVSASGGSGAITLSVSGLPGWAAFTDNGNGNGSFDFSPLYWVVSPPDTDRSWTITVTANDSGSGTASKSFTLTVNDVNRAPEITAIADASVDENATLVVDISSSDADNGDSVTLSATGIPAFGSLADNGDGTGSISFSPLYWVSSATLNKTFNITVSADDGRGGVANESFVLTVVNINRSPIVNSIADITMDENTTAAVSLSSSDPDAGDVITLSVSGLPSFGTLTDNGDGTGAIDLNPGYFAAGTYNVTVFASDGNGGTGSKSFVINVTNINQPPDLNPIADVSMDENTTHVVNLQANDPDGDLIFCSVSNCPSFGVPVDNGDGSGTITFSPGFGDSGSYTMTVIFDDGNGGTDSESFTLTVIDVPVGPGEVIVEAETLSVLNSSGDPVSLLYNANASGGNPNIMLYKSNAVGDFVQFEINAPGIGDYDIYVGVQKAPNVGIAQLKLVYDTSEEIIGTQDLYNSSYSLQEVQFGSKTFTALGKRTFSFDITGQNASSNNVRLRLDYIRFVRTN